MSSAVRHSGQEPTEETLLNCELSSVGIAVLKGGEDVNEDSFPGMFAQNNITFANTAIKTEALDGLYHRKLRTITGVSQSEAPEGGRQAARDLFDLYILDNLHSPIPQFINQINQMGANFPKKAFLSGMSQMGWYEGLMDEFKEIDINQNEQIMRLFSGNDVFSAIRMRMSEIINEVNTNGKTFKP